MENIKIFGPHPSHCCKKHGCKYGDDDCPVVLGIAQQEYKQECCGWEDKHTLDGYKIVLKHMKEQNKKHITVEEIETIIKKV